MSNPQILLVVRQSLEAIRSKAPADSEISSWIRDLERRIGKLDPPALLQAFDRAREDAAERRAAGRFGAVALDDVIRSYRKTPQTVAEVPQDASCAYGCREGHLLMLDRGGCENVAPCSCRAGEHQRRALKIYEDSRNIEELRRMGWTLKPRTRRLPPGDILWLMARSEAVGAADAVRDYRKLGGRDLPKQPAGAVERARRAIEAGADR